MKFPKKLSILMTILGFAVVLVLTQTEPARGDEATKAYLAGDLAKAEKLLDKEIERKDAGPSHFLLLGRVCFLQGKWEKAKIAVNALLEKDPENPQGRELLGRILFRLGGFKEALPYYEETMRQSPSAEIRLELAEVLVGLGRKTDAVQQLKKVVDDKRPWPRAHYLLGKLRLESGVGHWAARHLWIALQLGYAEKDLRLSLARAFSLEGRVTGPLFLAGPFDDKKVGSRTKEYMFVKKAEDRGFWYVAEANSAIYQIEIALQGRNDASEAAFLLAARCWLTAGDLDRASRYAASLTKSTEEYFYIQAEIALAREDLEAFRKLVRGLPAERAAGSEKLLRLLLEASLIAQVKGDLRAALALLQQADRTMPGRSEVLRPMVEVLAQMGRAREAKKKMRLLAELHPDSPEIRLLTSRYKVDLEGIEKRGAPVLGPEGEGR